MRWMKAVMAGAVFSAFFAGTAFAGEMGKGRRGEPGQMAS